MILEKVIYVKKTSLAVFFLVYCSEFRFFCNHLRHLVSSIKQLEALMIKQYQSLFMYTLESSSIETTWYKNFIFFHIKISCEHQYGRSII